MTLPDPSQPNLAIPPTGLMPHTMRMEQFNRAYIQALASAAGYSVAYLNVDDDSIDITIKSRARHGIKKAPSVDAQLKATANLTLSGGNYTYDLEMKNYRDLKDTNVAAPRILIVMHLPPESEIDSWISCNDENIIMRKRAYWVSLKGLPDSKNSGSVRVYIPPTNIFNVEALHTIMNKVGGKIDL